MRVFVTGATGFIGSAVVGELVQAGHHVVGLARSDTAAASLTAAGAEVHRGSLEDAASLRSGAAAADGVIHTAYIHDFSETGDPAAAARADGRAIEAIGRALAGSGKPLVVAGTVVPVPGRMSTEDDQVPEGPEFPRVSGTGGAVVRGARRTGLCGAPAAVGARPGRPRLRPGPHRHRPRQGPGGLCGRRVQPLGRRAPAGCRAPVPAGRGGRARGRAAVRDRRGGRAVPGYRRGHRAAPEPVGDRALPRGGRGHFGLFALFVSMDIAASSVQTQKRFGWHPGHPGLIDDLDKGHYFS